MCGDRREDGPEPLPQRPGQRGLTLIELIVFIIVVSVGLTGVLSVFDLVVRNSADPLVNKQAMAVADAMMEEILLKDFANPSGGWTASGPLTPADRPNFDNVGDYNGYSSGIYSLADTSTSISGLSDYAVAVTVAAPTAPIGGVAVTDILQITVNVTYGAGDLFSLTGYRFNYD